ncbi:MAG: DUF2950 domain-containing protein [Nitrospirae bacterium]|nr:DUF2950 domain-containing protein [Nitrospirota bacterium]
MTICSKQIQNSDTFASNTAMMQRRMRSSASAWAGVLVMVCIAFFAGSAFAKAGVGAKQRTFASPDEAAKALAVAVKNNNSKELVAILGPGSGDLIFSGDEVDDRMRKERFMKAYEEKNNTELRGADKALLRIGSQDRLFPIPVIRKRDRWFFDTKAGREELLCRRVGRNELNVINVLQAYTDAQREYAVKDRDNDGVFEFAQRLISTEGKRDGLYWDAKEGEEESPLGPLIAKASGEGYNKARSKMEPFHGYYFRIIKAQGPSAKGGAFDYIAKGHMVLGFGLLAYPAKYSSSGIMTFMVNQEGVIYQKDLGEQTARASKITRYDPDKTWEKVEEASKQQN